MDLNENEIHNRGNAGRVRRYSVFASEIQNQQNSYLAAISQYSFGQIHLPLG